jgi:hypothetical protein
MGDPLTKPILHLLNMSVRESVVLMAKGIIGGNHNFAAKRNVELEHLNASIKENNSKKGI